MSDHSKYTFTNEKLGTLELEVDNPKKTSYSQSVPDDFSWSCKGLDFDEPLHDKGLYFYEWQNISFFYSAQPSSELIQPLELRVNERVIRTSKLQNGVISLFGNFSFKNSVGKTIIEIRDARNSLIFQLDTEVFPQKMDYKSDYKAMLTEINQILQNLTFDILKDTFHKSNIRSTGKTTDSEWWNILDVLFENLITHIGVIKRMPKHTICSNEIIMPIEKIHQGGRQQEKWFQKNIQYSTKNGKGIKVGNARFSHAPSLRKFVTYDTWENRFVVWALKGLADKLGRYYKSLMDEISHDENNSKQYAPLLSRIKKYQSKIQGILHEDPFTEVGTFEKRAHFSTTLTRGAGYRDFMKIYLLLLRGLEIADNDIYKIEQKQISLLYEYWCFLKVIQLTKEIHDYDVLYQDIIKVDYNKIKVKLKTGISSEVKFRKKNSEETTTIYFNREYSHDKKRIFTHNQKPDYSISFEKDGYKKPFWYLMDAKYRFDELTENGDTKCYVPQDALGQMHRYRDSILHTIPSPSTYRSAIKNLGGVVLFPYPGTEEEYRSNPFYQSIKEVNIGAIPFLPSKTTLAREFLKELLSKAPESHFEQSIELDRSEYDQHRRKWNEWVTIDVIRSKDQELRLAFMKEKLRHNIPYVKNLHSKVYASNYLLLCQSGTRQAWLYEVESREVISHQELKSLGANWNLSHPKYISFKLKNGRALTTPVAIAPRTFRYATREGLNLFLNQQPTDKNYFYLTNPDAARLYQELLNRKIACSIRWVDNLTDPSLIEFEFDGKVVRSSENYEELHFLVGGEMVHVSGLV